MKLEFFVRRVGLCARARIKNAKFANLVGPSGLEPPTSRLSGVRSNHLSYEPIFVVLSVFCSSEPLFIRYYGLGFWMRLSFSLAALGFVPAQELKAQARQNWWR